MPKLELVRFIGTTVDDSMVEAMLALPELRRLGWLANPATEGALKRIRAGNPKIEVRIFKTWNTTEPPPLRVSAR